MTHLGMRVVVHPLLGLRRYTFDPHRRVPVSDEMRREMEAWALEFFKPDETVMFGKVTNTVYVSAAVAARLKGVM